MLIGNKIFPYPLLKKYGSNTDYETTNFFFDFDKENEELLVKDGALVLKNIHFFLDNPEMKSLYDDGYIKVICEVECSNTVFRKCFEIFEEPSDIEIALSNFANIVTISAYAVVSKRIEGYTSTDFVADYTGYSFDFEPSNIIAADDGIKFRVDIDEGNDNKISSIFTISNKEDAEEIITYVSKSNRIIIYLNSEKYSIYDNMKNHSVYNNFFFSNLVIPVLSSCLQEIQNEYNDIDSLDDICDDKPWFRSVMKRYAYVKGKDMELEDYFSANCFELSQLLMNESTGKCIKDFFDMTMSGEEVIEDE